MISAKTFENTNSCPTIVPSLEYVVQNLASGELEPDDLLSSYFVLTQEISKVFESQESPLVVPKCFQEFENQYRVAVEFFHQAMKDGRVFEETQVCSKALQAIQKSRSIKNKPKVLPDLVFVVSHLRKGDLTIQDLGSAYFFTFDRQTASIESGKQSEPSATSMTVPNSLKVFLPEHKWEVELALTALKLAQVEDRVTNKSEVDILALMKLINAREQNISNFGKPALFLSLQGAALAIRSGSASVRDLARGYFLITEESQLALPGVSMQPFSWEGFNASLNGEEFTGIQDSVNDITDTETNLKMPPCLDYWGNRHPKLADQVLTAFRLAVFEDRVWMQTDLSLNRRKYRLINS